MTHDVGDAFAGTCLLCNVRATCVPLAMCVPLVGGGLQISGAELQELQNEWEDYAFPPVGTAKFVLGMSVIQFIIKVLVSVCLCVCQILMSVIPYMIKALMSVCLWFRHACNTAFAKACLR